MTYKQIEASREVRLWIGQIIVPAVTATLAYMANPNIKNFFDDKINTVKSKFKSRKIKVIK